MCYRTDSETGASQCLVATRKGTQVIDTSTAWRTHVGEQRQGQDDRAAGVGPEVPAGRCAHAELHKIPPRRAGRGRLAETLVLTCADALTVEPAASPGAWPRAGGELAWQTAEETSQTRPPRCPRSRRHAVAAQTRVGKLPALTLLVIPHVTEALPSCGRGGAGRLGHGRTGRGKRLTEDVEDARPAQGL